MEWTPLNYHPMCIFPALFWFLHRCRIANMKSIWYCTHSVQSILAIFHMLSKSRDGKRVWWSVWREEFLSDYQSIRGDETVNVNKPSPVSPQLTARSGQSAQLVHCIPTHVNLHSDFGHPSNGTRFTWSLDDFILRAKEISRAFVYDDFLVSANGL
jgi:hypothetical protein